MVHSSASERLYNLRFENQLFKKPTYFTCKQTGNSYNTKRCSAMILNSTNNLSTKKMKYYFICSQFVFLDWSVSGSNRIIYNLNAPSPPTSSICLSTSALHQLSLRLYAPPSFFFLPSPRIFFFFSSLLSFVSFFISPKLPSSIHLPPHRFLFSHFQSAVGCGCAPWNFWHLQCDLIPNLPAD